MSWTKMTPQSLKSDYSRGTLEEHTRRKNFLSTHLSNWLRFTQNLRSNGYWFLNLTLPNKRYIAIR